MKETQIQGNGACGAGLPGVNIQDIGCPWRHQSPGVKGLAAPFMTYPSTLKTGEPLVNMTMFLRYGKCAGAAGRQPPETKK